MMGKPCNCKICGRPMKDSRMQGMCNKHYKQFKKYGYCLDNNPRTIYDLNEITICGDIALIALYNQEQNVVAQAIIDAEDVEKVKYIKWKYRKDCNYVINTGTRADRRPIHLHRYIMGLDRGTYSEDSIVDHINHNPLDNRKQNLRIVTKTQNAQNKKIVPKGIYEYHGKWMAYIKIHQRMLNLGHYVLKEEALYARWYAERLIFREFAYQKEEPFVSGERKNAIRDYVNRKCRDYNNEAGIAS